MAILAIDRAALPSLPGLPGGSRHHPDPELLPVPKEVEVLQEQESTLKVQGFQIPLGRCSEVEVVSFFFARTHPPDDLS
jgi:hypothetical protein